MSTGLTASYKPQRINRQIEAAYPYIDVIIRMSQLMKQKVVFIDNYQAITASALPLGSVIRHTILTDAFLQISKVNKLNDFLYTTILCEYYICLMLFMTSILD